MVCTLEVVACSSLEHNNLVEDREWEGPFRHSRPTGVPFAHLKLNEIQKLLPKSALRKTIWFLYIISYLKRIASEIYLLTDTTNYDSLNYIKYLEYYTKNKAKMLHPFRVVYVYLW